MNSLLVIIAGICWGLISIFVNSLKSLGFNSIQVVAIRCFFTAVLLILFCVVKEKSALKIKLKHLPYFLGTGILSIACFNFCYFQAITLIGGASVPALLLYTAPIFVMIISIFLFHEQINLRKLIALFLTSAGLVFITGVINGNEKLSLSAFLFGIGSGFCYALYSIFGKLIGDKYDSITITTYTFLIAAISTIPISNVIPNISLLLNAKGLLSAIGLALFCTVFPFLCYTNGLKKMEAGRASILATIEPLVASIIGFSFLGEEISFQKILGIFFIIFAVLILNLPNNSKKS